MMSKNGINERHVKQCVEANRHNSVTAYYYLLMKKKILEGELLEEGARRHPNEIITVSSHHRVNKSVLGVRTTKNG